MLFLQENLKFDYRPSIFGKIILNFFSLLFVVIGLATLYMSYEWLVNNFSDNISTALLLAGIIIFTTIAGFFIKYMTLKHLGPEAIYFDNMNKTVMIEENGQSSILTPFSDIKNILIREHVSTSHGNSSVNRGIYREYILYIEKYDLSSWDLYISSSEKEACDIKDYLYTHLEIKNNNPTANNNGNSLPIGIQEIENKTYIWQDVSDKKRYLISIFMIIGFLLAATGGALKILNSNQIFGIIIIIFVFGIMLFALKNLIGCLKQEYKLKLDQNTIYYYEKKFLSSWKEKDIKITDIGTLDYSFYLTDSQNSDNFNILIIKKDALDEFRKLKTEKIDNIIDAFTTITSIAKNSYKIAVPGHSLTVISEFKSYLSSKINISQ